MGVGAGVYVLSSYKSSRLLSHLLMSSCTSQPQSIAALCLVLYPSGWVGFSGWLHTKIVYQRNGHTYKIVKSHSCTVWACCIVTLFLSTMALSQGQIGCWS